MKIPFQPKALHDEMNSAAFDEYRKDDRQPGLEAPEPGPVKQNIVLYPYINPPIRMTDGSSPNDIKGLSCQRAPQGHAHRLGRRGHGNLEDHA